MTVAPPNEGLRVIVTTLDAVTQAELWLTHGARGATEVFLGVLRTALLLSGEIVVDRNQLLDGVCFLALGPDGVAKALGLDEGAPLPLLVNCEPADTQEEDIPRLLGRHAEFVRHPEQSRVSLSHQLRWVRSERFRAASSALAAVGLSPQGREWLYPQGDRSAGWFPGAGFTDVLHELEEPELLIPRLEQAQDAWVAAMSTGRVAADLWGGQMDMPGALDVQRRVLAEACGDGVAPHPLALHTLAVASPTRKDALTAIERWSTEHPELGQPHLMRLAVTLWSRAYYRAIAEKDDAMLLVINVDAAADATAQPSDARRFGLAVPTRTALRRWWDREFSRARPAGGTRVDGEILDTMRTIHPVAFRQLADSLDRVSQPARRVTTPSGLHDVALAARDAVPQFTAYREERRMNRLRMAIGMTLAVVVTWLSLIADVSNLGNAAKVGAMVAAALIGFFASLPWDELVQEFRTRPSAMTAILSVHGERQ